MPSTTLGPFNRIRSLPLSKLLHTFYDTVVSKSELIYALNAHRMPFRSHVSYCRQQGEVFGEIVELRRRGSVRVLTLAAPQKTLVCTLLFLSVSLPPTFQSFFQIVPDKPW